MYGCKCSFELKTALNRNICQIHLIYAIYGALCSSKKQRIHLGMAATTYCTLKKLFPAINYRKKRFFRNNSLRWMTVFSYESLLVIKIINKIFVHLSVIAAVCYFNFYKLIGQDPANIYWLKVSSSTIEKGVNYVQS